jgi:plastocyanin
MRVRRAGAWGMLLVVVAFGSACGGGDSSSSDGECSTFTDTTSVEMQDYAYAPSCISVAPDIELNLTNSGAAPHTFTVNDTDANADVQAGGSGTLDLKGVAAGTYEVTCTYHPGQMSATLKIG